ncbi:hypothetical protein PVA44_04475 [Entomospira nematocerorum]|uniref:Uncharacterized protein n=1 Tax=Entomospira nematocerorum TaxID=2719987 RepID=A0A968GEI3_9SPIO|nr:hypothetical protein [Entomospira nematocera]NIZ46723.1 hypothetical protein [Entomospira nematocera]WDI33481.1 hypothetical protein PVA44_04475 [Entomospira nematocera]
MHSINQPQSLITLLPSVKRVRGGYLYDINNRRYLDLWLHNGTLLQGHNDTGVIKLLKNTLNQTALMPYPNIWHQQLIKVVKTKYHASHVYIIEGDSSNSNASFTEPWNQSPLGFYNLRAWYPLPRDISLARLAMTLAGYHIIISFTEKVQTIERETILPAFLARAALKQLPLFHHSTPLNPLSKLSSNQWNHYGLYFQSTHHSQESYHKLFIEALDNGILLPPGLDHTGVYISTLFSEGQQQQIERIFQK